MACYTIIIFCLIYALRNKCKWFSSSLMFYSHILFKLLLPSSIAFNYKNLISLTSRCSFFFFIFFNHSTSMYWLLSVRSEYHFLMVGFDFALTKKIQFCYVDKEGVGLLCFCNFKHACWLKHEAAIHWNRQKSKCCVNNNRKVGRASKFKLHYVTLNDSTLLARNTYFQ